VIRHVNKESEMDPLFPELPEDLGALSAEELSTLLQEHEVASDLIDALDEEFIKGLSADEVVEQYEHGVEQIKTIRAEQARRVEAEQAMSTRLAELRAERQPSQEDDDEVVGGGEGEAVEAVVEGEELAAEEVVEEEETEEEVEEPTAEEVKPEVPVVASAQSERRTALRLPPKPSAERQLKTEMGAALVAAAGLPDIRGGAMLDRAGYARIVRGEAVRRGPTSKSAAGVEEKIRLARAEYPFPDERRLMHGDADGNASKIRAVLPDYIPGIYGGHRGNALVASGGLCAPLEPIYSMPNFASVARPVRDALPSFQADRGGVNVPTATSIGDITSAITVIEELEDQLGGTYATKSCQDLTCPAYTEVPVTIISHCREYGNLNSRAWPEKIAHENDLTMAAHARTSDSYLLGRIRTLSVVETSPQVLGAYADLVNALLRERASIISVLRMEPGARFRVLAPFWLADLLADDTAQTQFDRYQNQAQMVAHLEALGFSVTLYLDQVGEPAVGTSQLFTAAAGGVIDGYPAAAQVAVFPEGEFIHVDGGSLELGIVRDSTLNATNDYQLFGETFENVARLGPTQGARWFEATICPSGEFPSLSAARC
jgi:hypothetical protein